LWPDWDASDIQLTNWIQKLKNCEYRRAKGAVENVWRSEKIQHKRPPQGRIFEAFGQCVDKKAVKGKDVPDTTVFVQCIEPPAENPNRTDHKIRVYPADLSKMNDLDYLRDCGHYMAERFEELSGGKWIVIIEKPKPDSGLRGAQARDKAFKDILDGPDTKTKRWLQRYLDAKRRKTDSSEPVDIGAMALQEMTTRAVI
jgi:hypothetical protein